MIKGNFIDIGNRKIFPAEIKIENGIISSIKEVNEQFEKYILPGFIDAHIHIESSLLVPSEFARMAVTHGTIATVSDPHEIANVLGSKGIEFMIENGKRVPFHFFFGAPSCVPATHFETSGAAIDAEAIEELLQRDEILYLSEMMNFPGVLNDDPEVMKKIASAKRYNKPVDGHAPGLRGDAAEKYIRSGISTDHECYTIEEAEEKISLGMKILIREGSAAKNFDELIPLIKKHADKIMFCSDDKHPDSLLLGHINQLVSRAVSEGYDLFDVLNVACFNPIRHYKLPMGMLKIGDPADFIVMSGLSNFNIDQTYLAGKLVAEKGRTVINSNEVIPLNNFTCSKKSKDHFFYKPKENEFVIECIDGQLITNKMLVPGDKCIVEYDILKLVVVNRYHDAPVAVSFVKNFGLKHGAIASSVAHDSHNIIAVGINDEEICNAVNLVIENKGGLSAVGSSAKRILPLPVAGLMSNKDAWDIAAEYTDLHRFSIAVLGSTLAAPFMSLSFMALLVIPHLKLSDKGLFDGDNFSFIN